jgi:hypothetical protein
MKKKAKEKETVYNYVVNNTSKIETKKLTDSEINTLVIFVEAGMMSLLRADFKEDDLEEIKNIYKTLKKAFNTGKVTFTYEDE